MSRVPVYFFANCARKKKTTREIVEQTLQVGVIRSTARVPTSNLRYLLSETSCPRKTTSRSMDGNPAVPLSRRLLPPSPRTLQLLNR